MPKRYSPKSARFMYLNLKQKHAYSVHVYSYCILNILNIQKMCLVQKNKIIYLPTYPHNKIVSRRMANKQFFNLGLGHIYLLHTAADMLVFVTCIRPKLKYWLFVVSRATRKILLPFLKYLFFYFRNFRSGPFRVLVKFRYFRNSRSLSIVCVDNTCNIAQKVQGSCI